jgi:hypothetical protein
MTELLEDIKGDLSPMQWQSLLVGALQILLHSTQPESDIAYAKWLIDQWQKAHQN